MPDRACRDARVRLLEPTPKPDAAHGEWAAGFLPGKPPSLFLPAPALEMVHRHGFVGELFRYRVAALVEDDFALPERMPVMRWIMGRERGCHVFPSLLRSMQLQQYGSALAAERPLVLARRAGLSRGSVLNLLDGCERAGLVVRGWGEGQVRLLPSFGDIALRWARTPLDARAELCSLVAPGDQRRRVAPGDQRRRVAPGAGRLIRRRSQP